MADLNRSSHEAIVIGSGFAGAVTSARLALAGYAVTILERGRRYPKDTLPAMPRPDELLPDASRWSWGVDRGLWDIADLGPIRSVQAAGYGGGSLVYANVHLRPNARAFEGWHEDYTLETLSHHYDLAAAMLDVSPYPEGKSLPKSSALESAATSLGRRYFRPPLAINFEPRTDELGRDVPGCNDCGACCSGCTVGAKNTLDHNYLAYAEAAGARVHTSTEVVRIDRDDSGGGYLVRCRDHLRGGAEVIFAGQHVFLCAGALHSTRLLFVSGLGNEELGASFYGNGDALGMIYDAKTVTEPTRGPTITGAILCTMEPGASTEARPGGAEGAPRAPWFMIQDGGYTAALHRAFGLMRAPALGARNRFREGRLRSHEDVARESARTSPDPAHPSNVLGARTASLSTVLLRAADDERFSLGAAEESRILPKQLVAFLASTLASLRRAEARVIDDTIQGIPERFVRELVRTKTGVDIDGDEPRGFVGWLWTLVARGIAAAFRGMTRFSSVRNALVATSARSFENAIGLDGPRGLALERNLVRALGLEHPAFDESVDIGTRRRMMLLAMGDDREDPRTLSYDAERGVRATDRGRLGMYALEERVMRDVANELGGELRVNPLYAFDRETITVHGQGGCAMPSKGRRGVTDSEGKVHGESGLYVMDAACFPYPVGVNPTATILAIAERNVERFLAHHPGPLALTEELRALRDKADARVVAWTERWRKEPFALSPPEAAPSAPPKSAPVALSFDEVMRGFATCPAREPESPADFVRCENAGRDSDSYLTLELAAHIDDVAAFSADARHTVRLGGVVVLRTSDGQDARITLGPTSKLFLMREGDPHTPGAETMEYHLEGEDESHRKLTFRGFKYIHDDEGFDAWEDATRLFVHFEYRGEKRYGIVRLSMEDFVQTMLPSFEVTGTDDEARRAWAIFAFTGFFFSKLQRVYVPNLVGDLIAMIGVR